MPPSPYVPLPVATSRQHSVLPTVVVTIVVILLLIGIAWFAKPILFPKMQSTSLSPTVNSETTQSITEFETFAATLSPGIYTLIGSGAGQAGNYSGTVTIMRRETTSNIYDLVWRITSGQAQLGVGILTDGILSVSYYEAPDGSLTDVGVVSYKVVDSSHLEGEWTSVVGGSAGFEQLSLQPQL